MRLKNSFERIRIVFGYAKFGLILILLNAPPTLASIGDTLGFSPYNDWKTIETEHFRITFPVELSSTAQRAANYLEEAHSILSPRLRWVPHYKTQIMLVDNSDLANGLTTPVQRLGITLYVTPPENWFSTNYYENWLRLLCIHEYTHLLNIDTTTGYSEMLRYLFGDDTMPNALWPTWMLEGLAVYMETRYTHGGRGRSTLYDMMIRSAVDENVLDTDAYMTLDRVNGPVFPYYPGGETPYLFGYSMMNELATSSRAGRTVDREGFLVDGMDALGEMSLRSSHRIPYFTNDNLANITGRDWYDYWQSWVEESRAHARSELTQIHTQPVSQTQPLTQRGYDLLGSSVSPDGHWIAYTQDSLDEVGNLFIRDLATGTTKNVGDKFYGAAMAFSADSKTLFYSAIKRINKYDTLSDLFAYNIETGHEERLSKGARFRDPDISRDGQWLVFTYTENNTVGIARAHVMIGNGGAYALGPVEKIYTPAIYDRASTPKLSADGNSVVFTIHRNGYAQEDLAQVPSSGGAIQYLVSDGKYNRYPAIASDGGIYFISDKTGAENLYRYTQQGSELLTNVTTGLAFPTMAPGTVGRPKEVYANIFSHEGWDLAKISITPSAIDEKSITLAPIKAPQTPPTDDLANDHSEKTIYPVQDYSIIPSIWPRAWAISPTFYSGGFSLEANVIGYDAVDRHEYTIGFGADSLIQQLDWLLSYTNRSLGPLLTATVSNYTTGEYLLPDPQNNPYLAYYLRTFSGSLSAAYEFQWTYSSLTPSTSLNLSRTSLYQPGANPSNGDLVGQYLYVPSLDLSLSYSSVENTRLAVSVEEGRSTQLATRIYDIQGTDTFKTIFTDQEYFRVFGKHTVLAPSIRAAYSSQYNSDDLLANVVLAGRVLRFENSLLGNGLNLFSIRGYPTSTFYTQAVVLPAMELRVPLGDVFRGLGTNPFFFEHFAGFIYGEAAYMPYGEIGTNVLSSAGLGLTASFDLFFSLFPLTLSLEDHNGFQTAYGGTQDIFVQLTTGTIRF